MKTQVEPRKVDLRVVDVVARYEMKRHGKLTGVVVYEVKPSEKTLEQDPETPDYRVTFLDGVFQSCTCKCGLEWGKTPKCYHALQLIERERERKIAEPYASRLHNGVTLDSYLNDTHTSEATQEQLQWERDERRSRENNFALAMGY